MSFAYLALYTGDYFRDTRGLSMAGHGCYFLLLTYCWDVQGPLPLDEERIAGICEARNQEERTTLAKILRTYFIRMDDGWYNHRMQLEIEKAAAISLARKSAGAKGYQAKAKHLPSKSQASAKHVPLSSPPPPSSAPASSKEKPIVGLKPDAPPLEEKSEPKNRQGKALRDSAKRVLEQLNKLAGRFYDPVDANIKPILARFAEGYTEADLRAIAAVKSRQWRDDEKMNAYLRPKTLFTATNAAQYRAELPANRIEDEE